MQATVAKEEVHRLIDVLPDSATWDNLMYEINFMAQVHEGLADAEAGRVITTEELLNRMNSWRK
jgi:predicted transcriptional regulator